MELVTVLGIAVGLAMDAFAVSIGIGCCGVPNSFKRTARVALHFGLFQTGMTLVGYALGWAASDWMQSMSDWIAGAILWIVGAHMLYGAVKKPTVDCDAVIPECDHEADHNDAERSCDPGAGLTLIALSVATSLDAFGAGMGLALVGSDVWFASAMIGVVALLLSMVGFLLATRLSTGGPTVSRWAEVVGAVVIVGIGIKIAFALGA